MAISDVERAADELIARYGRDASRFAEDWARELGEAGLIPDESRALLVLSAVERRLGRATATRM
ncbi:MAG: hypothetical protein H3C38_15570 [Rhodospirillales bacterium]|nr:hypothetical protein [Rhodospirillales bacterium]